MIRRDRRRLRARVFLNVPFDRGYERMFVTMVAGLVALGLAPRCVLEIPERGQGRLARLVQSIGECDASVHDLSRVGLPARFNMPFELGLACATTHLAPPHDFLLFEREPLRLDRTLSDLKGRDAHIHGGTVDGVLGCLYDAFGKIRGYPEISEVRKLARDLWRFVESRKRDHRMATVYNRTLFHALVNEATRLAVRAKMI